MTQMLMFPDPRPLVERLGLDFFRQLPERPGVYLMRDSSDAVLYVGKAKNLRKRLAWYRVANPDRMPRRHLRMLRAVTRIELQECPDETAALATEAGLLRELRPRFNRAGTWPGKPRFLAWKTLPQGLALAVGPTETSLTDDNIAVLLPPGDPQTLATAGWACSKGLGAGAFHLRVALFRLLWRAHNPGFRTSDLPAGWLRVPRDSTLLLPRTPTSEIDLDSTVALLRRFFDAGSEELIEWIRARSSCLTHPFDLAARDADLETISLFKD